jgi:pimeloyl-ACP methyl ester carboxylesterase
MTFPAGLHVIERPAAAPAAAPAASPGTATVVLIHGSLDRAESFRRVMRRLPDLNVVAYDRRGYQGSRAGGVVDLDGHVADLLAVTTELRSRGSTLLSAVGHSLGGDVVVAAALADPGAFESIGAFEPPMPWLGFRRPQPGADRTGGWTPLAEDPGDEAEQFFSRMVSPSAWQRLTDEGRASRRADGPALVADMTFMRGTQPFDVMALTVPAVFGMGGEGSRAHHRTTVAWLGSHVPGAETYEVAGAQHGAHLSHPDHFATFIRRVVERATT